MRVLIVDDSAVIRRTIRTLVEGEPDLEVVGMAHNGEEAVEMAARLRPDVITLDVEMPRMDGLSALRRIMRECPTGVIMCSTLTKEGSRETLQAMRLGAADFVAKSVGGAGVDMDRLRRELLRKIRAIGRGRAQPPAPEPTQPLKDLPPPQRVSRVAPSFNPGDFDVVVVGSSTGGPPALETLLTRLPADLSAPIVIAQHMPGVFTAAMSERLDSVCALTVMHAQSGAPLLPGTVSIGEGGKHVFVVRAPSGRLALKVDREPEGSLYHPSVNLLFESAAQAVGRRTLGIVLTGMGEDGLEGGRALVGAGGTLLAQSEPTCVVYGMPKAVVDAGLARATLSPEELAWTLRRLAPPTSRGAALRPAG